MTPTMTPIARPSRVFLVESGWQYFLAWKDGTQLLWTHAGVTLDDRQPSFAETGIDAPPTEASMSNDLRSCSRFAPIEPLRVWDVTDHLGRHYPREAALDRATLGHTIDALAALLIMLSAQFGGEVDAASTRGSRLRSRSFALERSDFSPHEKYIVNPFDTGAWRIEKLFAGF